VDAASPARDDQIAEVEQGAGSDRRGRGPAVMVFNKIDAADWNPGSSTISMLKSRAVRVSARSGSRQSVSCVPAGRSARGAYRSARGLAAHREFSPFACLSEESKLNALNDPNW